jgi:hypothetical protein
VAFDPTDPDDHPGHTRIGERHTLAESDASWRVPRRTRFRPHRIVEVEIIIDNLSVTGAGVRAPADVFVRLGQVVDLRLGEHWGQVRVTRCRRTEDPDVRYWGVEFLSSGNDFSAELSARLDAFSAVHHDQMRG